MKLIPCECSMNFPAALAKSSFLGGQMRCTPENASKNIGDGIKNAMSCHAGHQVTKCRSSSSDFFERSFHMQAGRAAPAVQRLHLPSLTDEFAPIHLPVS